MSNKKKLKENLELLKIMLGVTAVGASVSASMAYLEYKYSNDESHKNTYKHESDWYDVNSSKIIEYPEGPVAIDYNDISILEENSDTYSVILKNGDKITVYKDDAVFIENGKNINISNNKKILTKTK